MAMGSTSTTTTTTTCLSISSFFILFSLLLSSSFSTTDAVLFEIRNNCPFPVWAAALPGGGRRLDRGQTWPLNVNPGTASARIWGRTNCNFDGSGRGGCQTGDCGGALVCSLSGATPATLAEYTLSQPQFNQDSYDISLVDGFNLPMAFNGCQNIICSADINGQCPNELRVPGGCRNPHGSYSKFFKDRCPTSYSFPEDRATFTCPPRNNYGVVFCP